MSGIIYHKTTAAKILLLPFMLALESKGLTPIELFTQTDITDIMYSMSHRPIFQLPNWNCNDLTYTWIPVSSVGVSVPELRLYGPTFVAWPRNHDLASIPSAQLPRETAYRWLIWPNSEPVKHWPTARLPHCSHLFKWHLRIRWLCYRWTTSS